jgi:hypothetical protein
MISPDSSASPTVGPDGDVYYGVLENPYPSHDGRGWLLHYNATLTRTKTPGSFGWDNTVSVLAARVVPRYHGTSPYLLVSKYNNYYDIGLQGDGHNEMAVLDPRASQKDPYAGTRVMKAIQTIPSPVHKPGEAARARYEWCINSAAVDPADDSVIVNSEDGTSTAGTWPATPWRRRSTSTPAPRGLHPHPHRPPRHGLRHQQRHPLRHRTLARGTVMGRMPLPTNLRARPLVEGSSRAFTSIDRVNRARSR